MHYVFGMKLGVAFYRIVVFGGIALAMIASRDQLPNYAPGIGDWIFIGLMVLLLAWCVSERAANIDTEGHEQPSKGLAFRIGKSLNRIRRRLRG